MAYTIISQNNNTTTLSDGTNTITVPGYVNLATSTSYTISEVNNNTATLEGSDGSVIRDVPCVVVLAGEGGGGGSGLPDQTGHSGEFLTTDGTDASWAAVDALPSQTGNSGKFLTTDGTDASWSQLIPQKYDSSQHYFYLTDRTNPDIKSGAIVIGSGGNSPRPNAVSQDCVCIGTSSCVYNSNGAILIGKGQVQGSLSGIALNGGLYSGSWHSIAIGGTVNGVKCAMQFGNGVNSETGTVCFALSADNGTTFTNYKLLDSDGTIPTARFTKVNTTITLTAAGWSGGSQSVTVSGITATGVVFVNPDPTDQSAYTSAGILCTAQAADSLTFTATTTPSADIDVNVVML